MTTVEFAMSRISMKAAHHLGKVEAERRLKERLRIARDAHGRKAANLRAEWSDGTMSFAFDTLGASIAGTLVVLDTEVRLAADVPFHVAIFKRLIERRIRAELGDLLDMHEVSA